MSSVPKKANKLKLSLSLLVTTVNLNIMLSYDLIQSVSMNTLYLQ